MVVLLLPFEWMISVIDCSNSFSVTIGKFLVNALPVIIKLPFVIGTLALLLVSIVIFVRNVVLYDILPNVPDILVDFIVWLLIGFLRLLRYTIFRKLFARKIANKSIYIINTKALV
jgi:predicted DNA repair protein MutK